MVNNCLVTKLKGNVQNNDIPYLSGVKITLVNGSGQVNTSGALDADLDVTNSIKCSSGSIDIYNSDFSQKIVAGATSWTPSTKARYMVVSTSPESVINIIGKYDRFMIRENSNAGVSQYDSDYFVVDLDTVNYSKNMLFEIGTINKASGTLKVKTLTNYLGATLDAMNEYFVDYEGVTQDSLIGNRYIPPIIANNIIVNDRHRVKNLNIEMLSKNLLMINSEGNYGFALVNQGSEVYGEVRTLLDNLQANGKTQGTLSFIFAGTNVTLDGKQLTTEDAQENGYTIYATYTSSGYTVEQR